MDATNFALHVLAVVHALAASLACFGLVSLAGVAVIPRRWAPVLMRGGTPAVIGSAAYILACWYGIERGVRLTPLAVRFAAATIIVATIRARHVRAWIREASTRRTLGWLALFAALYVLAYVFTLPPVSDDRLPLAWLGNDDLLWYLVYSSYVQRLGTAAIPIVNTTSYIYSQTPAAFYLLGAFSRLYAGDVMRAAMPAQFAFTALSGVVAAWVARRVFATSRPAAALVGASVVSAPFLRFISGHYYLSTLIAIPVVLNLLVATLRADRPRAWSLALAWSFVAHDIVLFFTYPYLLPVALMFQGAVIVMGGAARWQRGTPIREVVREAAGTAGAIVAALLVLVACAPRHVVFVVTMLRDLSKVGSAGWALDVVSPLVLLGLPAALGRLQAGAAARPWAVVALFVIGLLPFAAFVPSFARRTPPEPRVFLGLFGLGFLAYGTYYLIVGPSYQQWKLASYTVLPLSFVAVAASFHFAEGWWLKSRVSRPARRRLATAFAAGVALVLVGGNVLAHAVSDVPLRRFPGELRRLSSVEALGRFRDLSIDVDSSSMALLSTYFIPGKRLHISAPSFYPTEPVVLERVSPAQPLLKVNYGCEGIGHDETRAIEGIGCLIFEPPSLVLGRSYPFNETFLFIEPSGLAPREPWGRWNRRPVVELSLTADKRRIRLDSEAAYVNLLLQPCLAPGMRGQRIALAWGAGRRAELVLEHPEWISLPVDARDWAGEWVATQKVSLRFVDMVPPHWVEGKYFETRSLAVGFLKLSVTTQPDGRVLAPGR